ncbi:alanine racemase [Mycolicibacterium baixiangningiae]|uniref:alanine racemase n=1 Tax=Mycolicibacterium baixiangningiae TaxID=2761578 RepID=UPI0018E5CFDA|nr:alanine racemase [Mycolicibacterium baixiangningiae]
MLDPQTPFLLADETKIDRNIDRLQAHLERFDVPLRPHVKTSKSTVITRKIWAGRTGPITVSTLAEGEVFAADGFTDILYAVGIAPDKLQRVVDLRRAGVDLTVLLDSIEQAQAVADASSTYGVPIPALLEVDCDGHRGGVLPGDPAAITIAEILNVGGAELRGVLTHAGESYFSYSPHERAAAAETERRTAVAVAETLRAAGHPAPIVSVGSTPTAHAVRDLTGVTEVRAGNFVFFDLVMAGIGVCALDDLALSAVVSVIGHRPDRGWILTDGGWTATSRDRGTAVQAVDQGYGLVADIYGELLPDVLMSGASQEHGVLSVRPGSGAELPALPIGTRLRILPNHACAMGIQHSKYSVVQGSSPVIVNTWERAQGW